MTITLKQSKNNIFSLCPNGAHIVPGLKTTTISMLYNTYSLTTTPQCALQNDKSGDQSQENVQLDNNPK